MVFSQSKSCLFKPEKEKYLSTFFISLFVAALIILPSIIMGNGYFTFLGDLNSKQIAFYKLCHQAVREGNLFWNYNTNLGASFLGTYSPYVLGSPFFWLTVPFPNWIVPYLIGPIFILKFGFSALTAYSYIRRFTRIPNTARLGGLLYAFSAFAICDLGFANPHESLIIFPLLLLALELLITENRRMIFALTVAISAVVNFSLFFGMLVFALIYLIVRILSGAVKVKFPRIMVIVFEVILGLALSAFLLLPSVISAIKGGNLPDILLGWDNLVYTNPLTYPNIVGSTLLPTDITANSFISAWLPLFSIVGVVVFFSNKKNHWLKRIIAICGVMALIPILNSAFYFFNTEHYANWFFMPILMMCLATVTLIEESNIKWSSGFGWVLGVTLGLVGLIGLLPTKNHQNQIVLGLYNKDSILEIVRFWGICAIGIISLFILGILLKQNTKNRKAFCKTATVLVCIIAVIYGNFYITIGKKYAPDNKVLTNNLIAGNVNLEDKDTFRVDFYDGQENASLYLGLAGTNTSTPYISSSLKEFYSSLGNYNSNAVNNLLSVKYILNSKYSSSFINEETGEPLIDGYEYIKTESDYYIYENKNFIPQGFSYPYYISNDYFNTFHDFERSSLLLKAVLLNDKQILKYGSLMGNIEDLEQTDIVFNDEENNSLEQDCETLRKTSATYFKTDKNGFSATVTREAKNLVFFSIPYDRNWTAYVNGEKVEIEKVNAGFMAVMVDKGVSDIRFNYESAGLVEGLVITGFGCFILLVYLIVWAFYNKKPHTEDCYPEGDELIKLWKIEARCDTPAYKEEPYEKTAKRSILDDDISTEIPHIENSFTGGFTINKNLIDKDKE